MSSRRPTLAAVVRTRQGRFHCQVATSTEQRRVLSDITACRTQALGGHVFECDQCDHRKVADNPCGNRHCPQCQAAARAEWLDKRLSDLLPVVYFHVVFTLPHQLGPLALQNRRIVYGILFRSVTETLLEVGETRLAAHFGFLTVLHTFSRGAAETGAAGVFRLLRPPTQAHCIRDCWGNEVFQWLSAVEVVQRNCRLDGRVSPRSEWRKIS